MNLERINEAIEIAQKLQYFFVATANKRGVPHVATAGRIKVNTPERLEVSFWFCPQTLSNLQDNKQVSLIIWDAARNRGVQIQGRVEDMQVEEVLDGFAPDSEEEKYLPQVCWWLLVKIDSVMEFINALHSDAEI